MPILLLLCSKNSRYTWSTQIKDSPVESLLSSWIARDPDIFFELRNREQNWSELPVEFKNAIDLGLCTHEPKQLESFAGEILVAPQRADSRRIEHFIHLMTRYPPDEARVRVGWPN